MKKKKNGKKSTALSTRLLKCQCENCGYTIRVTRKWMATGLPTCVCGTKFTPESGAYKVIIVDGRPVPLPAKHAKQLEGWIAG